MAPGAAAGPEYDRPRPAKTRFPIDMTQYTELKEEAPEAPGLPKRDAELVRDRRARKPQTASAADVAEALAAPLALGPGVAAAPVPITNFAGIPDTGFFPADCTLAAGPQHVLVAVNSTVAVYPKTGGAPVLQRTLTSWFSNVIGSAKIFDPKALYDQFQGRWVLLTVALATNANQSWFLLSVSKTSDPLGGWFNYKLDATRDGTTATNNWADFPGLGVDSQALYLTANMFRFGGDFQYAKIRIVPKSKIYSGGTATFRDFVKMKNEDGSSAFTVQPCHTFGAPQVQYFVNSYFPSSASSSPDRLSLWNLTNPLTTPTLTRRTIRTAPYALPPDAPQKGNANPLDTGDVRILGAVFRGGSVWTALTTRHDWGDGINVAAAHWFQINPTSGQLVQQGIFGAPKISYYYPAVQPDGNGNMVMVFSRSSSVEFVGIYFTGRQAADPLGQLQPSVPLKLGAASSVHLDGFGRNRWGDYAGIANDPTDNRTVWMYSMFASAGNQWGTWIGATRF
jgi:hypothetical protein